MHLASVYADTVTSYLFRLLSDESHCDADAATEAASCFDSLNHRLPILPSETLLSLI
jgi:hypothetical protein